MNVNFAVKCLSSWKTTWSSWAFSVGQSKISQVTLQSNGLKRVLRIWFDGNNWLWLGINNTNVANIFWKNTLSRSLAEVKHFRNTLDVNSVSSFHGWSFSYSEQYVWSVSSCPPLFCPANKLSLSCVVLGALWDNGIPDAEASSQCTKKGIPGFSFCW